MSFLLGFAPYLDSPGSAMMYGVTLNAFEPLSNAVAPLSLLLLGGLLSGISLLPKQNFTGPAAASAVTGFLAAFALMLNLPGNSELAAVESRSSSSGSSRRCWRSPCSCSRPES